MAWIISYLVAFLLLAFDLICFHSKNRVSILGKIVIFFIPLANVIFEITCLIWRFLVDIPYRSGYIFNDNKITRWLFNDASDSDFYRK